MPGLVGLPYDYLSAQLGSLAHAHPRHGGARLHGAWSPIGLSDSDITAVAASLASRQLPADTHAQAGRLGDAAAAVRCVGRNGRRHMKWLLRLLLLIVAVGRVLLGWLFFGRRSSTDITGDEQGDCRDACKIPH